MEPKWKLIAAATAIIILAAGLTAFYVETQLASDIKLPIRVACVGDSLTSDSQYPSDLAVLLGENYTVGNFGVGRTTVSLQFEKPYLAQSAARNATKFEPNIVVIMLGTDDAYLSPQQRSNFVGDYKTLVATFQELSSKPKIFIAIPPPVFSNSIELNSTILERNIIPSVEQTAIELNLPLIDAHTPLANHPEDFSDGVHLNTQGSQAIATQVFDAIT